MPKLQLERCDRISPPFWSEVWIIGGGPSAGSFDLERLKGQRVLAVNDAIFKFCSSSGQLSPSGIAVASISVFSLDSDWVRRHCDFLNRWEGEKYLAPLPDGGPELESIPGACYLQQGYADGLSEDPTIVNAGCHSGYGALGVAYLKRAWNIHLVGYDLDPTQEKPYQQFEFWARNYDTTRDQLRKRRVAVWNHNKQSSITAFPKVN